MASLIGTLGTLGASVIGNLLSKGVSTLGDVASNKIDQWGKNQKNQNNFSQSLQKQVKTNTSAINSLNTRVKNIEQRMELE